MAKRSGSRKVDKGAASSRGQQKRTERKRPKGWSFPERPGFWLFLFALAVRLVYLATLSVRPGFTIPIVDEVDYDKMARLFATGQGFGEGALFRPPLWPMVLGTIYIFFGQTFPLAKLANVLFGALAVAASYRLGDRLFGRRTGIIAAGILSVFGLMVHYSGMGLATSLFIYLSLEALNLTLAVLDRPTLPRIFTAGLLWGLASLARPVALVPAIISACAILVSKRVEKESRFHSVIFLCMGLALAILPVTFYNIAQRDPALICTNGGINFYFGNNQVSNGMTAFHPAMGVFWTPERAHQWVEARTGRRMSKSEVSQWYMREGMRFLIFNPGRGLRLLGQKFLLTFSSVEISNNGDLDFLAKNNPMLAALLPLGFGLVAPFGIIGMILFWRRPAVRFTSLIALSYLMITVAFFFTARFRLPAVPIMVVLGVAAGEWIYRKVGERQVRRAIAPAAGIIILGVLVNSNLPNAPTGGNPAYGYLLQGKVYAQMDRLEEARDSFEKALEEHSHTHMAHLFLGQIEMQLGNAEEAAKHFEKEIEMAPKPGVYKWLGLACRQLNRREEAEKAFRRELELSPADEESYTYLAQEIGERGIRSADNGDWKEALEIFLQAARIDPYNPFFPFAIASCHWALGEKEKAEKEMAQVLRNYPKFAPAIEWKKGWRPDKDAKGGAFLSLPQDSAE